MTRGWMGARGQFDAGDEDYFAEETMATRVKVVCNHKSTNGESGPINLQFSPVYSGSDENKSFFAATPGGSFQFYTVNRAAADQFEMGKEYYFDIFAAQ